MERPLAGCLALASDFRTQPSVLILCPKSGADSVFLLNLLAERSPGPRVLFHAHRAYAQR
ncbi:MAG: hypothetical protein R3E96_08045 [Planctomycetota bacterium]